MTERPRPDIYDIEHDIWEFDDEQAAIRGLVSGACITMAGVLVISAVVWGFVL